MLEIQYKITWCDLHSSTAASCAAWLYEAVDAGPYDFTQTFNHIGSVTYPFRDRVAVQRQY